MDWMNKNNQLYISLDAFKRVKVNNKYGKQRSKYPQEVKKRQPLQDKTNQTAPIHQNKGYPNILPDEFSYIKTPKRKGSARSFQDKSFVDLAPLDPDLLRSFRPLATSTPKKKVKTKPEQARNLKDQEESEFDELAEWFQSASNFELDLSEPSSQKQSNLNCQEVILNKFAPFETETDEIILF
ncbi:meiotic cohesin complex associated protein Moa1 [Schizosaccharomyces cryophilus OY26]|uniref:Meiotic cohesin complex associated protein Moa1 n=1 Tax=Schizosaccharomyces cryophilus (strain OY26 / ATCC MYA-4695 / CBS 11777 / NBRC 106824 / NRRL Y48691) TaxID=653667 RepID=S9W386_SCHCR|nr:meiotic cohesin complex associated protein Moa1 [Schizosaccharomyces cryophilus OY26]EPY53019.1 meiotic cohesin complex associated protein Moa1 [Schizosaccharomyces cryophilus OY26]